MRIYNVINIPKGLQEVECNCQEEYFSGYTAGHEAGEEDQKAKLSAITITTNGSYTRGDGYSAITVNVPQSSGSCNIEEGKFVQVTDLMFTRAGLGTSAGTYHGTLQVLPDEGYDGLGKADLWINADASQAIVFGTEWQKDKLSGLTVTENGNYIRFDGYSAVTVNVPDRWQTGYDSGYTDGVESGGGDYASGYTDGYNRGIPEGENRQKAKLSAITISGNGEYTRADGYSAITVNVPGSSNIEPWKQFEIRNLDFSTNDPANPVYWAYEMYGPSEGYDGIGNLGVNIEVPAISAVTYGENQQKAKLASTSFTQNGVYMRGDGWGSVAVNVPQSGYTQQDLDNAFNSGWTNGYNSGYTDGYNDASGETPEATALTLNVPSSITGSGQASVTVLPSNARTNLSYTSSDPTVATISSNGTIYVLSAGTVTITVADSISQLSDSETITVTPASGINTPLTVEVISAGTILWVTDDTSSTLTIEYQKNGGDWTSITSTTAGTPINVAASDVVSFRGDNPRYGDSSHFAKNHILMQTGRYEIEGNIMSLIDSANYSALTGFNGVTGVFIGFFKESLGLVDASKLLLPVMSMTNHSYFDMFSGCTNLVLAPALPATVMADSCYKGMFQGCTSLTTAPVLPATTLADDCYANMFLGCSSLTSAPVLPATTLANNCYVRMFQNASLTTAPALPATTLADSCYAYMFQGCGSLTTAPALPATALTKECYDRMFWYCTSLTTVPELPAPILHDSCYQYMFQGCSSLNYIKCLAISGTGTNTTGWVQGVAASGTFVKDANATWLTGDNGIPNGWTVQDAQ